MTTPTVQDISMVAAVLIGTGFLLLLLLTLIPNIRRKSLDLLATLFSATLILLCLLALFLLGPKALIASLALAAARIGYEVATLRLSEQTHVILAAISAAGLTVLSALFAPVAIACAGLWFLLFARQIMARSVKGAATDVLLFPILPLALLAYGAAHPALTALMLTAYVLVEIFDSFALLTGSLIGRNKAFPVLSPNKTYEGLAGGALALVIALVAASTVWDFSPLIATATALFVGALAVAGDLAASRHKRIAGVKDYPRVLARQGGLLDSLDSWISASAGLVVVHFLIQLW
ncbi:phosphatidate cytidylyltransferase [Shimia sp. MMG029]|uniref:phosphatidate cytidylyltransferase n=1 Tax=Shimia sp. MMG029 TaxID=3021978 RepID=UPI0022FE2EF0|nr:phosphatidate cytidylyltransferase [Shimia sp. MMG029]MDA5557522.1 phosphatidate cytidylyltransferase [Shimia sp. MMG029]